jgi:membrane fusion protein, multidrug efflux system
MNETSKDPPNAAGDVPRPSANRARRRQAAYVAALVLVAGGAYAGISWTGGARASIMAPPRPPEVTVATPLLETVSTKTSFLGQFSAVDEVEIRAQVGGYLTEIHFTDGQIVHKGDLLFVIDPRPYRIALEQATASYQTAKAQLDLATQELWRAQQLKQTSFGTAETVDQRIEQQRSAAAALAQAEASIHTAALNLEFTRIAAPFNGKISAHRVSVGSLIAGSNSGGTTTLLTTLVSLDPIHLDFDMSENDFLVYRRALQRERGTRQNRDALGDLVEASVGDEDGWNRRGTLDFVDNAMDRGSGTIHVRANFPNHDLFLAPGQFARLRLALEQPKPVLLVPDGAVSLDQSQKSVMTVGDDSRVVMKTVATGGIEDGLRVVRAGLTPSDRVIINGLMRAMPGAPVTPVTGAIRHPNQS